jgi:hypothetical protein
LAPSIVTPRRHSWSRLRGREETSKKAQVEDVQEVEAARQLVQDKKAMEQARHEASKRAAAEEAQMLAAEKQWIEKKAKALKDAKEEKKRAKIAVNPFAFLDDTEKGSEDEDEEEEEAGARARTDEGAGGADGDDGVLAYRPVKLPGPVSNSLDRCLTAWTGDRMPDLDRPRDT